MNIARCDDDILLAAAAAAAGTYDAHDSSVVVCRRDNVVGVDER